uniref:Cytochrome c oxidase subunit 3 n=1 Tax=Ricinoides karschii TaxID=1238228 RepID=W5R4E1_9ARAC|nr:cytochrome c oxidase subunit III [Ricinoides karschii]AGL11950.1 cytochrome c oxidase subunit III [Ricinoides karschii]
MQQNRHPYHMVEQSPWPLTASFSAILLTTSLIMWFHSLNMKPMLIAWLITVMTMIQWWRDVTRESTLQGHHSLKVIKSLKLGMILFIISEVMFFLSFFWSYFHMSLAPSMEIGMIWPPSGITTFNPFSIPLLNTAILISSGVSVTWCHHAILTSNLPQAKTSLFLTILLGFYFTCLQLFEYKEASFSISDSCYGSTFFVATGFHGLHVIIGTTFLTISFIRLFILHWSHSHHFGFEASAWYWHFVDVVWLFLFVSIYWWGGC